MSGSYKDNNGIKQALRNHTMQKYIYNNADNLQTAYEHMLDQPQPTDIFPSVGMVNNIKNKTYNDPTFENGTSDYYNWLGRTKRPFHPFFNDEDDVLADTIKIGLNTPVKQARTIGNCTY